MKEVVLSPWLDRLGRRYPRVLVLANVILLVLVSLYLLTTTEAPIVLYQAF